MVIQEIWSIPLKRIADYLFEQEGFRRVDEAHYLYAGGEIRITVLENCFFGPIEVSRTQVTFCGEDEITKSVHRRFVLKFLSAGG